MENWEGILLDNYGAAAVNKKIVLENEIQGIPRYVSEYIVGVYGDDEISRDSINEACLFIKEHMQDFYQN